MFSWNFSNWSVFFPAEPREAPKWPTEARLHSIQIEFFHQWWLSEGKYSISEVFENSQIWPHWRHYIQFWKLQVELFVKMAILANIWDRQRKFQKKFLHSFLWYMANFEKKDLVPAGIFSALSYFLAETPTMLLYSCKPIYFITSITNMYIFCKNIWVI